MKKFAAKLLLFVVIFLIYDKLFIIVVNRSAETEVDKRLEYLIHGDINKDIIIVGSSTGSRDIIAGQIENNIGLSTYNLCYPGSNILFHEFILRTLVEYNEPPKMILFMVDDDAELRYDRTINFRKERLYPLIKYSYIRNELEKHDKQDKLFSHFLILNRLYVDNLNIREKRFTPWDTIMQCGSMPISWQDEDVIWNYDLSERLYHKDIEIPEMVLKYREIIEMCHTNNIKLVIVFPPVYKKHSRSFENRIRQLSGDSVYFYTYDLENPIFRNKDYFFDVSHLTATGAKIFTDDIILFLDDLIEELNSVETSDEI